MKSIPVCIHIAVLVALAAVSGEASERPPNILFLFADDQRNHTLGCAGHPDSNSGTDIKFGKFGDR